MIIVDVETTGLDPERNSILSIGALNFSDPKDQFYGECTVWKGAEIDRNALRINGFTIKDIEKNPKSPEDLMKEFLEWSKEVGSKRMGGYYTRFDYSFLRSTAKMSGIPFPFRKDVTDLHNLFSERLGVDRGLYERNLIFSLNEILVNLGLPPEPDPHNALRGAKFTAEALSRIKKGKGLLKDFEKYPVLKVIKL